MPYRAVKKTRYVKRKFWDRIRNGWSPKFREEEYDSWEYYELPKYPFPSQVASRVVLTTPKPVVKTIASGSAISSSTTTHESSADDPLISATSLYALWAATGAALAERVEASPAPFVSGDGGDFGGGGASGSWADSPAPAPSYDSSSSYSSSYDSSSSSSSYDSSSSSSYDSGSSYSSSGSDW